MAGLIPQGGLKLTPVLHEELLEVSCHWSKDKLKHAHWSMSTVGTELQEKRDLVIAQLAGTSSQEVHQVGMHLEVGHDLHLHDDGVHLTVVGPEDVLDLLHSHLCCLRTVDVPDDWLTINTKNVSDFSIYLASPRYTVPNMPSPRM